MRLAIKKARILTVTVTVITLTRIPGRDATRARTGRRRDGNSGGGSGGDSGGGCGGGEGESKARGTRWLSTRDTAKEAPPPLQLELLSSSCLALAHLRKLAEGHTGEETCSVRHEEQGAALDVHGRAASEKELRSLRRA